jgi:hypothetical protein
MEMGGSSIQKKEGSWMWKPGIRWSKDYACANISHAQS